MRITTQQQVNIKPQLADVLSSAEVGDTIRGRIVELLGESISIRTSSGQLFTAALMSEAEVALGQRIELQISKITDEGVFAELTSKSPKSAEASVEGKLKQLFMQLDIKPEHSNIQAAKLLLKFNMPVTKENIINLQSTQKNIESLAQADPSKVIALLQTELNINDTEINTIMKQAAVVETQRSKVADASVKIAEASKPAEVIAKTIPQVQTQETDKLPEMPQNSAKSSVLEKAADNNTKAIISELVRELDISATESHAPKLEKLVNTIAKALETAAHIKPEHTAYMKAKEIEITPKMMKSLVDNDFGLNKLSKQLEGLEKLVDTLEQKGADVKEVKQEFKKLFIKPEDFQDKEKVTESFKDILKTAAKVEQLVKEHGLESKVDTAVLQDTKTNLDFVRVINNNINYIQIPIQLNENKTTADIYVFQNKKKSKDINPESATILIALDLFSLGHLESLISVQKKKVDVTFKVEKEEFKKVIRGSADILKNALEARGYRLNPLNVIDMKEKFNLLELEELERTGVDRLHLDIKV